MLKENFLFEISWEVCNKVGGIHTVITSKIEEIRKYFKNYFLVGPYLNYKNYENEFQETKIQYEFEKAYEELLSLGIKLHFGKWINQDNQQVILVEYLDYSKNINDIKKTLWEKYKIDSLGSNWYDFDEAILWSWCCGIAIETLSKYNFIFSKSIDENVFVHAHEWMSGGAIFYLKQINNNSKNKFKTVFTTHATMLGRTISSSNENLYKNLENLNPNDKAYQYNIYTKHQSEKALANISDCFTTVSQITNYEAKYFYQKEADILLPNGFNVKLNNLQEDIDEFKESRKYLNDFLEKYSQNYQNLDLKNSLIFYTSGRNEYKDKGVDIYIKSLGKLNEKLKLENNSKNIINFFLIPIGNYKKSEDMLSPNILPFSTNEIPIENQIIQGFLNAGLYNTINDKIKVIFIPIYLNLDDGILNKNYYDIIKGMDLGVFPSLYEPWGYTPMESISFSVPTITSDLAGFGKYCLDNFEYHNGVKVLIRENENEEKTIDNLANFLHNFSNKTNQEIIKIKEDSKNLSQNFTWEKFISNYLKAYEIAQKK